MLLGMGGLLYWKFAKTDPPAPAPPPPVATKPPEPEIEVPPPPPPEETPEPPKQESLATTKKKPTTTSVGGCGPSCSGTVGGSLNTALSTVARGSRSCYERALRQNPTLQGRLMVSVRVGATGGACSASLASDALGDPSVANCVLQKFRGSTYPKPEGGCVDVQVPIQFMPKVK